VRAPAGLMVGLVLVSHSRQIADGLAALVGQVAGDGATVEAVGGALDGSLGTDGGAVLAALRRACARGDVLVLMDLGSAVLSVRAALEELEPAERARVRLADAPLVEGAIAAGVLAAIGATLAEVAAAAQEARHVGKL
jgi:dihydroxyacetone kinase phosphotransfer subunit